MVNIEFVNLFEALEKLRKKDKVKFEQFAGLREDCIYRANESMGELIEMITVNVIPNLANQVKLLVSMWREREKT